MNAVRLHAVHTPAKVLLPSFARRAAPLFVVVLHGFLAHSGAMNSFVVMLRNALDAHNTTILETNDATAAVLPFHITTLDARNHGLSPHTPTHVLSSLVDDLDAYLRHQLPETVHRVSEQLDGSALADAEAPAAPRVLAIGHSMGSMTWAQYLMDRHALAAQSSTAVLHAAPVEMRGLVSLDMPPITRSHMAVGLVEELVDIIACMKAVDMHRIHDLRSAHDEFYRCGMQDIRVRGLCTTNLAITPPDASRPTQRTASWKCNVPVLEQSLRSGDLFFPDHGMKDRVPDSEDSTAGAAAVHRREATLASPSVGEVPVLSILGGASPIGGCAAYGNVWERYAVNLEQHTIPGATHTVYYDKPRETIELVKGFMTEIGLFS